MKYDFNPKVAKTVGTDAAIIYSNIQFWEQTNRLNDRNYYEGRYWTYNSYEAFEGVFTWLSRSQIKRCIKKLVDSGYILEACYNENPFDRTKWYTPEETIEGTIPSNVEGTIPSDEYKETDSKPELKNSYTQGKELTPPSSPLETIDWGKLLDHINEQTKRSFRKINEKARTSFKARLKEGYKKVDIWNAIINAPRNDFHKGNNCQYLTPEYFSRATTIDKFGFAPRKDQKSQEEIRAEGGHVVY